MRVLFRIAPALCAGAVLSGCVVDPKVTSATPYEGNVGPLAYVPVSGAPVQRNATSELVRMAAAGVALNMAAGTPPTMAGSSPATQSLIAANANKPNAPSTLPTCRNGNEWSK